ncbi:MAG: S-methyl-5-thioribose-1-phosphate isomerase [Betaproteobacteria bacterium]|nr:MAG: S-methyl-5-thioribose-1-phosphate isomerase [Betaproteobacteria bacterium]
MDIPELQTLCASSAGDRVEIIDQTRLPHARVLISLASGSDAAHAIRVMQVRGAPLIGATAAYGLALALRADPSDAGLAAAYALLIATRPTAVNLRWALDRVRATVTPLAPSARAAAAWAEAGAIATEDVATNRALGEHGVQIIERFAGARQSPVQILTHCNAGALATLGWGTATAPIYLAHAAGVPLHVWVSETRPRLQGARLTAWELRAYGVPHTLVVDAAGAALMRQRRVDLVLVGADRVTRNGDVCNKIGTYEKALAARDNDVPMYAAVPSTTIDWALASGDDVPIEERDAAEVLNPGGEPIAPAGTVVANPAFDVTPGRLLTGLITERGVCAASKAGLSGLFPERIHG